MSRFWQAGGSALRLSHCVLLDTSYLAPAVPTFDPAFGSMTKSNANLTVTNPVADGTAVGARTALAISGKTVIRFTPSAFTAGNVEIGVANSAWTGTNDLGSTANSVGFYQNGYFGTTGTAGPSSGAVAWAAGSVIDLAIDPTTHKIWPIVNGTAAFGWDPVAGTGGLDISHITGALNFIFGTNRNGATVTISPASLSGFTSYVAGAAPISALVLTKTSATGAAPFTFDIGFDATHYVGDDIRGQLSTSASFTTGSATQDFVQILAESDLASGTVTFNSGNGLPPPSGTQFYVRSRVERIVEQSDNSMVTVVGPWSNVIGDTITVPTMVLTTGTTGHDKSQYAVTSGTPALTFTTTNGYYTGQVRANRSFTGQKVFAFQTNGAFKVGLDQSTTDYSANAGYGPGIFDNFGVTYNAKNDFGKAVNSANTYSAYTYAAGDSWMVEHDTGTGQGRIYLIQSGVRTLMGSHTIPTGPVTPMFAAADSSVTGTANFGQSTFLVTPTSGYTYP